jgi:hypothetical protein
MKDKFDSTSEHHVTVYGEQCKVAVSLKSEKVWRAEGRYGEHFLEGDGKSELAALKNWEGAARYRRNDTPIGLVIKWEPRAKYWKTLLQMIIGLLIPFFLAVKLFLLIRPSSLDRLNELAQAPILEIVGIALLVSTALDLAYMLFTPGPDEAVEPVITGLAATLLIFISQETDWSYQRAGVVVSLVAGIGFMFWVREKFID